MQVLLLNVVRHDNAPVEYLPVFLLLILAIALGGGQLLVSAILGKRAPGNEVKNSPYECGIEPEGDAHTRFSVKFYLVAVLFILFDIEVIFLYPWAVHFGGGEADAVFASRGELVRFLFLEMFVFITILFLGWYWIVKKRALDWEEA